MKVALAQTQIDYESAEENLTIISNLCSKARSKGADTIIFPEYSVTGPLRGKKYTGESFGFYLNSLSKIAKKYSIDLVPGSLIESDLGRQFNTTIYLDKNGALLHKYRKINLWHGEKSVLSPGESISVFRTSFGLCGLAICWDIMNPTLFRQMAKAGAKYIFVPSFWSDYGKVNTKYEVKNINTLCYARALENECAIIFSNAAGTCGSAKKDDHLVGHSQVSVPIKDKIKIIPHNSVALEIIEIPEAPFKRAAKVYKIRESILD
ncbi:MAG: carbon-nitrogen hydrolase family protein [Candidatus Bilamarchaeum sp.]